MLNYRKTWFTDHRGITTVVHGTFGAESPDYDVRLFVVLARYRF